MESTAVGTKPLFQGESFKKKVGQALIIGSAIGAIATLSLVGLRIGGISNLHLGKLSMPITVMTIGAGAWGSAEAARRGFTLINGDEKKNSIGRVAAEGITVVAGLACASFLALQIAVIFNPHHAVHIGKWMIQGGTTLPAIAATYYGVSLGEMLVNRGKKPTDHGKSQLGKCSRKVAQATKAVGVGLLLFSVGMIGARIFTHSKHVMFLGHNLSLTTLSIGSVGLYGGWILFTGYMGSKEKQVERQDETNPASTKAKLLGALAVTTGIVAFAFQSWARIDPKSFQKIFHFALHGDVVSMAAISYYSIGTINLGVSLWRDTANDAKKNA